MKNLLCLMTLGTMMALLANSQSFAQEASDEIAVEKPKDDGSKTAAADETADEQAAKVNPYDAIRTLIQQRKLEDAAEQLETAIKEASDDDRLHDLRDSLAQSYLRTRKYDEAFEQLRTSFEHRISNADNARNQARLTATVSLMQMAALRAGKQRVAEQSIDRAIDAIDANDFGMVSIAAKSRLLYAAATLPDATDDAQREADEFISNAVEEYPESGAILSEFVRVQTMFISRSYRDDPEAATERLNRTKEVLGNAAENAPTMKVYLARLKSYESRIEAALRLKEMVGEEAPALEIDAWVNQGKVTEDSLKGKVVLIDFWSVWCGPCIATFPHLREWYDEFHEQGLEIVGVTRYYGYKWDEEAKRATKSKDKVEADDELETLAKFMQHHELRHPTIVTPKSSTMQKAYNVTGIPHAVLIDRKGNVQMIKIGSGSSNAEALHAKIKELIAQ